MFFPCMLTIVNFLMNYTTLWKICIESIPVYDRVVVRLAPYKEKSFENTAHLLAYSFRPCLTEYYLYVDGNYFLCLCATFQFVVKKIL